MTIMQQLDAAYNIAPVDPAIREQNNSDAWAAVAEGRAEFLVDRPEHPAEIVCDEFEPSEEDWADYLAWSRERDRQLWIARVEAGQTLAEWVRAEADRYRHVESSPFAELAAEAMDGLLAVVNALDAKTVEDYRDRRESMLAQFQAAR